MKKTILFSMISLLGSMAFADQCAYITKAQAEKALRALTETQSVQSLCEPCGERKAETLKVDSIGLRKVPGTAFSEVAINAKGIDLAYTYVNGLNLAQLAGCPVQGVSSAIK